MWLRYPAKAMDHRPVEGAEGADAADAAEASAEPSANSDAESSADRSSNSSTDAGTHAGTDAGTHASTASGNSMNPNSDSMHIVIEPIRRGGRCVVRMWDEAHEDVIFDFWPRGLRMGSWSSTDGFVSAGVECLLWIVRRAAMN